MPLSMERAPDDIAPLLTEAAAALDQGQVGRAFLLAKRALMQVPDDTDALNLAGIAAAQAGDAEEARSFFETALAFEPSHVRAQMNLGNLLRDLGELDAAEAAYRRASALDPETADIPFNWGVMLEQAGRFDEAEARFRTCLIRVPGHAEARFHLANIAKARGRLGEALASFDVLTRDQPNHAGAWVNRGAVLQEMSRSLDAIESTRKALSLDPQSLDAGYNLATMLQETGAYSEAAGAYRDLLARAPGHVGARVNLGFVHRQLGDLDAALGETLKAAEDAPDYDKAHVNLGDLHLARGETSDALRVARDYLETHPGNPSMLAFLAIALAENGDVGERDRLLGLNGLIRPQSLSAPEGYDDMAAFNRALAAHVRAHPSLTLAPASHATRKGRHSGELLDGQPGPIAQLAASIRAAAGPAFQAMRAACPNHPALIDGPDDPAISIWGVVMEDAGHQLPHIHPSAWLSGVYYPELPGLIREDDADRQGWIEFGRAPDDFHVTHEPHVKLFKPEEGLMILFPSFLYHRTVPFHAPVERMSIAFDLVARG